MAVISKKKTTQQQQQLEKWVKGSWEWNIQPESTIIQKKKQKTVMFNSSSTLLSFQLSRIYISKTNLQIILDKPKT